MRVPGQRTIVVLGIMSIKPVAGVAWATLQYLLGLQRLGYDVYYVEAHASNPLMLMRNTHDDGSARAAAFIDSVLRPFGLGERWAFHALHAGGQCYGMSDTALGELYRSADLLINLHGATRPRPEHIATGRLVYLETDPVTAEIKLHDNVSQVVALFEQHSAFFSWGLNYGNPDCAVPLPHRFKIQPTRPPVILDLWQPHERGASGIFTTIGSWRQMKDVTFRGEIYHWSKHYEFLKFIDLPARAGGTFELALSGCNPADMQMLRSHGWRVRDASTLSAALDAYRRYVMTSAGEFTVAKDQNVRLRSGWFSERSATYLAAARPVITQETGFSNVLPTGRGLFGFTTMEEILMAVETIRSAYDSHRRAAYEIAREYFNYDVVLPSLLSAVGL